MTSHRASRRLRSTAVRLFFKNMYTTTTEKTSNSAYRKISNIRRTKSQNLNDSRLVLQLSLLNLLKPGIK